MADEFTGSPFGEGSGGSSWKDYTRRTTWKNLNDRQKTQIKRKWEELKYTQNFNIDNLTDEQERLLKAAKTDIEKGTVSSEMVLWYGGLKEYEAQDEPEEPQPDEPQPNTPVQETPSLEQPNPEQTPPEEIGHGGDELGNPENAPPDPGLHAVNDYLIPGETDTTLLQAYDLWDIDASGRSKEDVEDYNKQVREWNKWMGEHRSPEDEDYLIYEELEWGGAVQAPTETPWEQMMSGKIDIAKADEKVTADEVNDIFANAMYYGGDVGELSGFVDEQLARELRKEARWNDSFMSMNRTFGLNLGPINVNRSQLF